jgi:hypothetical protein
VEVVRQTNTRVTGDQLHSFRIVPGSEGGITFGIDLNSGMLGSNATSSGQSGR